MNKANELSALVAHRKASRWEGYGCIGDYQNGIFECDFVSPYTRGAKNLDASVMVLLQDWSSDQWLREPTDSESIKRGHGLKVRTNIELKRLLKDTFGLELQDTYSTNLFPFIKQGGLSTPIPQKVLISAAREFAIPQINIIKPRLVVCLGLNTFNALRRAHGLRSAAKMNDAITSPFDINQSKIWCQAHTGSRGQSNRTVYYRYPNRPVEDWEYMRDAVGLSPNE
jgi:hypothetical protein